MLSTTAPCVAVKKACHAISLEILQHAGNKYQRSQGCSAHVVHGDEALRLLGGARLRRRGAGVVPAAAVAWQAVRQAVQLRRVARECRLQWRRRRCAVAPVLLVGRLLLL